MKLAEALLLRADLQKRLERIKERLVNNAKVQEGDSPAENPEELMAELARVLDELTRIIQRINKTNCATQLDSASTIADLLAKRDIVKATHSIYTAFADAASVKQDRYSRSEVKFKSTIDVSILQKRADDLAKEYREIDTRIQEANWQKDLLE
jgi:hypothetical protein